MPENVEFWFIAFALKLLVGRLIYCKLCGFEILSSS